jgi:hypothetical protein
MKTQNPTQAAGIGDVEERAEGDMLFPTTERRARNSLSASELSPSKRRAAARTKTFTANVNPELYAVWDGIREGNEQSVVRALELSLIAFLEKHGKEFEL